MKELFIKLKEAEEKANKADAAYEANPYDEELERAFDEVYAEEYIAFSEMAAAISKYTEGQISEQLAATMLRSKREQLEKLFA